MELDAGAYTTAKVSFGFTAAAGACVKIIYAECVSVADAEGNRRKELRDAWNDPTARMEGVYDTVYATGERQSFSPFWYRAFRFVRLEFPADAGFEPDVMTFAPYFYPMDVTGSFFCSDGRLNRMWDISRNTVLCCTHEMYVDCPYYEQQMYPGDTRVQRPQRNHGGWKTARARPSKTKVSPKPPKPLPFHALRFPLYHFLSR